MQITVLRSIPIWLALGVLQAAVRLSGRASEDSELGRRLKARDQNAMSELYDRYGRLVYSLIFRVVRDSAAAEDLTQETFLRVWNRSAAFDAEKGSLGPWIVTVARNRAIDYLRSSDGRMAARSTDLAHLEHPALFTDFKGDALSLDRARTLKEAFKKLSPQQKTVIELAYYEGLSQTEMAERMQQPLGTVKTWVRAALKVLRDQMGEVATA